MNSHCGVNVSVRVSTSLKLACNITASNAQLFRTFHNLENLSKSSDTVSTTVTC